MPNPTLNDLLKQWSDAESANDPATGCPPISVLWSHATDPSAFGGSGSERQAGTEGRRDEGTKLRATEEEAPRRDEGSDAAPPPSSNLQPSTFDFQPSTLIDPAHIAACPRCQKLLTIIRSELAKATAPPSTFPFPTRIRRTGAALAIAASIALVFIIWPTPDSRQFDTQVAAFANDVYRSGTTWRGDGTPSNQPSDEGSDSIADPLSIVGAIMLELLSGGLVLDADGQPVVAPDIDVATERGRKLADLVADDRAATERIVDAFIQAIPEASEKNRAALRRSLNRWRAKELFGIDPLNGSD